MLSGWGQYSESLFFFFFSFFFSVALLLSNGTFSPHHSSSLTSAISPSLPFPCGFSIRCHTWPPPTHYALFCVLPMDGGPGRRIYLISIHLWTPVLPVRQTHSLFISPRCSVLYLRQCSAVGKVTNFLQCCHKARLNSCYFKSCQQCPLVILFIMFLIIGIAS